MAVDDHHERSTTLGMTVGTCDPRWSGVLIDDQAYGGVGGGDVVMPMDLPDLLGQRTAHDEPHHQLHPL